MGNFSILQLFPLHAAIVYPAAAKGSQILFLCKLDYSRIHPFLHFLQFLTGKQKVQIHTCYWRIDLLRDRLYEFYTQKPGRF